MNLLSLLTAFGLGSVVTAFIQSWLSQKSQQSERRFREKQTAYIGLLEAYHRCAVEGTDEAAKSFALWQMRCELVAPQAVLRAIERVIATNEDKAGRAIAHDELKAALRADLGIAK